jgi:hypothetical protein
MTDANQISSQQSTPPGGGDHGFKKMLQSANEAVKRLGLKDFIQDNKAAIYGQLEDCDTRVSERPSGLDPNAAFVAQSLPLIGGVIHVGSSRTNFDDAATWVQQQSPHAEPNSLLSTLVLLYIVDQGWQDAHAPNQDAHAPNDEKKKAQWESIYQRAKWLCEK